MKTIIQRVSSASVTVDKKIIGEIGPGLCLLVGCGEGDSEGLLPSFASKIANMRIFPDEKGRFHHSLLETGGGVLVISQFTLFADTSKGRRPEFFRALKPELAKPLILGLAEEFRKLGITDVAEGEFGANMQVALVNEGPVTIPFEMG